MAPLLGDMALDAIVNIVTPKIFCVLEIPDDEREIELKKTAGCCMMRSPRWTMRRQILVAS